MIARLTHFRRAMNAPSYADLLQDERWERRSCEFLESRGWLCEDCGDRAVNVHHRRYKPGREPWAYNDVDLMALCRLCHMHRHRTKVPAGAIDEARFRREAQQRRERDRYFRKMGWQLPTTR